MASGWLLGSLACSPGSQHLTFRGEGVLGGLQRGAGCGSDRWEVGLWGPSWGTEGWVEALPGEEEAGGRWLYLTLQTALGSGEAALWLGETSARLPMGARPGEFDVQLKVSERGVPEGELGRAEEVWAHRGPAFQRAWDRGELLLVDQEAVVGELRFSGESAVGVALCDPTWCTPHGELVLGRQSAEGADLLIQFPVEPSLQGEAGALRINVAMQEAVVPSGESPDPEDRRLSLKAGRSSPDERRSRQAQAREEADAAEQGWVEGLLPRLEAEARRPEGCASLADLGPEWSLALRGYEVELRPKGPRCQAIIQPSPEQHRRRYRRAPDEPK